MWQHCSLSATLKMFFESHPVMVTFPCKAFRQLFASSLSRQLFIDAKYQ